jgi:APA family basic amino acid/polyamine antiporter
MEAGSGELSSGRRNPGLGQLSLVCLVVANMIGVGVFTTSGFALAELGSAHRVMLAWVVGGLIAFTGALSYAGLAQRVLESGGEYVFLARLVHPLAGFVAGWVSLLAGFTAAIAFAALAFETYAAPLLPVAVPANALAIAIIALSAVLHGVRVQTGAAAQNAVVLLKLALIGAFIIYCLAAGLASPPPAPPPASEFSMAAFAGVLVWVSLSYSGFNAAVYVTGEAREAGRTVPRALSIGTLLVTGVYLLLNAAFLYLAPHAAVAGRADVAAAAALAIGGPWLETAIRVVIMLALTTSVFSMMMAGPRVYARMADDGFFPRAWGYRGAAPRAAIALQAVLAVAVVLISDLRGLLGYLGFTLSLSAAATVAALFIRRGGEGPPPVPGYPFTPAIFIAATLIFAALAARRSPVELTAALVTIGSGCLVYAILGLGRRADSRPAERGDPP